jgi:hypothetical protein
MHLCLCVSLSSAVNFMCWYIHWAAVAHWLGHYATSRKVMGSGPHEVNESFRPRRALGFTQSLTEMSTRIRKIMFLGSRTRLVSMAGKLQTFFMSPLDGGELIYSKGFFCPLVRKLGKVQIPFQSGTKTSCFNWELNLSRHACYQWHPWMLTKRTEIHWIELNWIYLHSVDPVQANTIGYGTSQVCTMMQ